MGVHVSLKYTLALLTLHDAQFDPILDEPHECPKEPAPVGEMGGPGTGLGANETKLGHCGYVVGQAVDEIQEDGRRGCKERLEERMGKEGAGER